MILNLILLSQHRRHFDFVRGGGHTKVHSEESGDDWSGGMLLWNFCYFTCSEIISGAFWHHKQCIFLPLIYLMLNRTG